jgi:hypothetical protein
MAYQYDTLDTVVGRSGATAQAVTLTSTSNSFYGTGTNLLNTAKVKQISISTTPTGSEQDTGWDLPAKSMVIDVWVDVTTAEATGGTKTLDVGLLAGESGGDLDGFIDGVSVSTTGIKKGVFVQTTGSNNNYLGAAGTHTRGVLLTELLIAGEDTAAGGDGVGIKGVHLSTAVTAKSVVYKAGSNDFAEFRGTINILYVELP